MGYHSFNESGHICPQCGAGPVTCMAEDGYCDNDQNCSACEVAHSQAVDYYQTYGEWIGCTHCDDAEYVGGEP